MSKSAVKMQSWQIFHFARKQLGASVLYAIFGKKNARKVDYWAQNPRCTNKPEGSYDPISGVKSLVETLDDYGHTDVARATITFLTSNTSLAESQTEPAVTDLQDTMDKEILMDYRAVGKLERAIEAGDAIEDIEQLKTEAIEEIIRTVALYRKMVRR